MKCFETPTMMRIIVSTLCSMCTGVRDAELRPVNNFVTIFQMNPKVN